MRTSVVASQLCNDRGPAAIIATNPARSSVFKRSVGAARRTSPTRECETCTEKPCIPTVEYLT